MNAFVRRIPFMRRFSKGIFGRAEDVQKSYQNPLSPLRAARGRVGEGKGSDATALSEGLVCNSLTLWYHNVVNLRRI